MIVAPIEVLLSRLDRVRIVGQRAMACCPAHPDQTPSLSIKETDDGVVLVYCHGGCETCDVLAAVGLTFRDLFPRRWR